MRGEKGNEVYQTEILANSPDVATHQEKRGNILFRQLAVGLVALTGLGYLGSAVSGSEAFAARHPAAAVSNNKRHADPVTFTYRHYKGEAESVVSNKVTFLAEEHYKGSEVPIQPKECEWVKTIWNSGYGANGKIDWFKDDHDYICRDKSSPTGWVKRGGGMTGLDCGNLVKFVTKKAPGPVVKGKVDVVATLNDNAQLTAKASAEATAECSGPGGSASATASASAVAEEEIKLRTFLDESHKAEGRIVTDLSGESVEKAYAKALATATATCTTFSTTTTTTTPPPPQQTPPTFQWNALPPAQEAYTDGYTYQDCGTATAPNNDSLIVNMWASDTNGSVGPVFQPNPSQSPEEYCADITISSNAGTDPSFSVDGQAEDTVTGLYSPIEVDDMGTQPMPSLGNILMRRRI